jgi:hypothetical protein
VISLAIQLAGTAQDIKNFISSIQDAPKELDRLTNLLDQLYTIANSIKVIIERQQKLYHDVDSEILQNVSKALQTCKQIMLKIEELVKRAGKLENGQNKLSRTWNSIRLVIHKKDIEELETQLAGGISLLNVTLTLNLTWVTMSLSDFLLTFCSSVHFYTTALVHDMSKTTRPELSSSNPTSYDMSNETHHTDHLIFYDLTNEPHHLATFSRSYWRHLTVDALHIYTKIYEACKDENDNVSCKRT